MLFFAAFSSQGSPYPLTPNVVIQNTEELESDVLRRNHRGRDHVDDPTKVDLVKWLSYLLCLPVWGSSAHLHH